MTVRAKFRVSSTAAHEERVWDKDLRQPVDRQVYDIELYPVTGTGTPENDAFFASTPSGAIKLLIVNPAAAVQFMPGQEYYVDFTQAP